LFGVTIDLGGTHVATRFPHLWLVPALLILGIPASAQTANSPLAGTSWQLVSFKGADGRTVKPDDGSKYTIAFAGDGMVAMQIDCNRGAGPWKSPGPGRLELGPLAVTRALCLDQSMFDQIVGDIAKIQTYAIRNGHLFLGLMSGGAYEYQPMAGAATNLHSPVSARGPFTFTCTADGGAGGSLRVTFYPTQPGLVLLERDGTVRPAFQVRAASGSRYEGDSVSYWEARGEATVTWMGRQLTCKRSDR
jgi:heat shock protein HslJ/membrane-bound inhibitor of C-type lysozyme